MKPSRIDMIGHNGGDGEHYNMQNELDNKYLVLKWSDIDTVLNNSETRKLAMMLTKIEQSRAKEGKTNREYVVVSERSPAYDNTYQTMLDIINGELYMSTNQKIYKAVEKALVAEREKIKGVIPTHRVVIDPDPSEPDEVEKKTITAVKPDRVPSKLYGDVSEGIEPVRSNFTNALAETLAFADSVKTPVELAKEAVKGKKDAKNKG